MFLPQKKFPIFFGIGLMAALALCPFSGNVLDQSAHDRVMFWGLANAAFKSNPVFGLGYDMFWMVTPAGKALHNAFVKCYTELGLLGYYFWFGLILLGILGAWRARMALTNIRDPNARWLRRLAGQTIVAMMGFCGSAYFLSRTFVFPLFFLASMLGAMPLIAKRYLPDDHPPLLKPKRDAFWLGSVGAVGSVIYIYISIILLNKAFYG
jgi:O-antigen ligase